MVMYQWQEASETISTPPPNVLDICKSEGWEIWEELEGYPGL